MDRYLYRHCKPFKKIVIIIAVSFVLLSFLEMSGPTRAADDDHWGRDADLLSKVQVSGKLGEIHVPNQEHLLSTPDRTEEDDVYDDLENDPEGNDEGDFGSSGTERDDDVLAEKVYPIDAPDDQEHDDTNQNESLIDAPIDDDDDDVSENGESMDSPVTSHEGTTIDNDEATDDEVEDNYDETTDNAQLIEDSNESDDDDETNDDDPENDQDGHVDDEEIHQKDQMTTMRYNISGMNHTHRERLLKLSKFLSHMYTAADLEKLLDEDEEIDPNVYTTRDVHMLDMKYSVRQMPKAIIIGARKAGTGALQGFLSLHPNITAPKSEPYFFADDKSYRSGVKSYLQQLPVPTKGQILIEKSAEYFHSFTAPQRLHAFNSSIKIILIVRDPYVRAMSDYMFLQRYKRKVSNVEKYFSFQELLLDTFTGRLHEGWGCLRRSVYYVHLQKWLKWFPKEQIHIVNGDEFASKNPGKFLRKVEEFLGVKPYLNEDLFYFDEMKGFYCLKRSGCFESKGHTQASWPKLETLARNYFHPWNKKFYALTGINYGWL